MGVQIGKGGERRQAIARLDGEYRRSRQQLCKGGWREVTTRVISGHELVHASLSRHKNATG